MYKLLNIDPDVNVYVVGDIHGCYSLLLQKLKEINFNFMTDLLICVGDLIDRGPENEKCISLLKEHWFRMIKGNHEAFCVAGVYQDDVKYVHSMSNNGGDWFYALPEDMQLYIANRFKQLPTILEVTYMDRNFGFVHADVPIHDWSALKAAIQNKSLISHRKIEDLCLWSRDIVYQDDITISNIHNVFLGHTVLDKPKQVGNCTFLDTGAVFKDKSTTEHLTIIKLRDYV